MKYRFLFLLTCIVALAGLFWAGSRPQVARFRARSAEPREVPANGNLVASADPTAPATVPAAPPPSPAVTAPSVTPREAAPGLTPEHFRQLAAVPAGDFRRQLLRLEPDARARALRRLARARVPKEDYASLHLTPAGDLFYACDLLPPAGIPPVTGPRVAATLPTGPQAAPVPLSSQPVRHSRPGAAKVLYLDFNGHTITGTLWNTGGGAATYVAKPYDTDNDPATFSDAEQADIVNVWSRVAEDYAPFDVDVTTEEPAVLTPTTGRALITANVDANGVDMPSMTAGGVAYLGVFGDSNYATFESPALIYFNRVGGAANIAEAVSHELGHNLGLSHDGRADGSGGGYYGGHGTGETSWGPLMGTGYSRHVSQWSKGEYYDSNNPQDDFAIIAARLGYRTDEAGDTLPTAAVAGVTGGALASAGVIARAADTDLFAFNAGAGAVNLTVTPFVAAAGTRGNNADLRLELLDAAGNVLATADPAATTGASLASTASAGLLYVRLSGAGTGDPFSATPTGYTSYGSAGQYTLTGTFPAAAPAIVGVAALSAPAGAAFTYAIPGTNGPASYSAAGLPAGLSLNATTGVISGRPTALGLFNVTLGATNTSGTGTGNLALTITDAPPVITAQTGGRQPVGLTGTISLSVTALSANGTPTYQWWRNGQVIAGATAATLNLANVTMASAGVYRVSVTNTVGTTVGAPAFVQVAPLASGIAGWGTNTAGQTVAPGGLTNAIALAAAGSHALALKADGTVVAWGANASGQATVPAGLSDVVAVAASAITQGASPGYSYQQEYSLALKGDGTVVAWGADAFGQTEVPIGLTDVVAIAAGYYHVLALKADGTVVAWGYNASGQTDVPAGLSGVVAISAGPEHSLARKADGTVVAWGYNNNGETNVPVGLSGVVDLAAGGFHSVALKADGTVANWGFASYGAAPGGFNTGRRVATGYRHTVALKTDGTVAAWGNNTDGQTTVPGGLTNAFEVAAAGYYTLALRETTVPAAPAFTAHPASQTIALGGSVTFTVAVTGTPTPSLQWRKDGAPLAGATGLSLTIDPVAAGDAGSYTVVATNGSGTATSNAAVLTVDAAPVVTTQTAVRQVLAAGDSFTHTVAATGAGPFTYQWYHHNRLIAGATGASYAVAAATAADAGAYHAVATNASGSHRSAPFFVLVAPASTAVSVWGDTASGQGTVPGSLTDAVALSAGTSHLLALKRDGTVVAWGANTNGQTNVPAGLTGVVAVFAGQQHSLALKRDGTVVAWGWNASGQANVPAGLSGVIAVAGGDFHSYALKTDGTIVGWGNNTIGQITIPGGLTTAGILGTGASHALVIRTDDTVLSWGNNGNGQATVPGGLTGVAAVEGGGFHSLAAKSDGTVVAWGSNTSGQSTVPGGLTGVTTVAAGASHSLALKSDGTVAGWGLNTSGQATIPGGLSRVLAITGGGNTSAALRDTTQLPQTISFGVLNDRPFTTTPLPLVATASSGLTVTFAVVGGPATVTGSSLTLTGTGAVTVRASQAGDATYAAAPDVDRTCNVTANFASWAQGRFTADELLNHPELTGPNAVYGQDGLTNLVKYALGLDPKQNATTALPDVSTSASDWVYTYVRSVGATDLTYEVEVSTNLTTWTTAGVTHELVSTGAGTETWHARYPLASAANVFFRLKVTRP